MALLFPFPMATSSPSAALNAEPSWPDEREGQDLKPKSYVDAVREGTADAAMGIANGTSTPNGVNGTDSASQDQHASGSTRVSGQGAPVLRIVQTQQNTEKPPSHSDSNSDTTEGAEQIPGIEHQESKHEYSAKVCTRWISTYAVLCVNINLGS